MIILVLTVLGLILGSFVNALVWRIHEQAKASQKIKKPKANAAKSGKTLSIMRGRSMCTHCHHELAAKDLIPVVSWTMLGGKCRYCKKQISWQYPLVELVTAILFVLSYVFWPHGWDEVGILNFVVWLVMLVGFMALLVYDLRWMLLPNRIVYPLILLALGISLVNLFADGNFLQAALRLILSVGIAGGIFYALFTFSKGAWIGGGDVKLGLLLGLLLADPYAAFMLLLTASMLGTLVVLPGLLSKRLSAGSRVPFGPFLIVAGVIVYLFGASVIEWYKQSLYFTV